jgi:hypothetical protein
VYDIDFSVELKNLSFAYMDVGKGREQDAASFTHRLSGHFLSRWGIKSLCTAPS